MSSSRKQKLFRSYRNGFAVVTKVPTLSFTFFLLTKEKKRQHTLFSKSIFHVEPKSGRTHLFATKNARDNNQANHFASEPDGNDNWFSIPTSVEKTLQLVLNLHKFEVNFNQYLSLHTQKVEITGIKK